MRETISPHLWSFCEDVLGIIVCFELLQERSPIVNLASALENEGISTFRFDFSGNGYVKFATFSLATPV